MKVVKLALVLMFVVGMIAGCGGKGGGGGGGYSFDECVKAGMAQVEKSAGSPQPSAQPAVEMGCQPCKTDAGGDPCKMIVDNYKK